MSLGYIRETPGLFVNLGRRLRSFANIEDMGGVSRDGSLVFETLRLIYDENYRSRSERGQRCLLFDDGWRLIPYTDCSCDCDVGMNYLFII